MLHLFSGKGSARFKIFCSHRDQGLLVCRCLLCFVEIVVCERIECQLSHSILCIKAVENPSLPPIQAGVLIRRYPLVGSLDGYIYGVVKEVYSYQKTIDTLPWGGEVASTNSMWNLTVVEGGPQQLIQIRDFRKMHHTDQFLKRARPWSLLSRILREMVFSFCLEEVCWVQGKTVEFPRIFNNHSPANPCHRVKLKLKR